MVEWFIFIIHGLVYDFIVANLSCCCLEYYIDDEITMLIDERWLVVLHGKTINVNLA